MFSGCTSLNSLDISGFNSQKVNDMSNIFNGCSSLEYLDLSSFNSLNCKSFDGIFNGCEKLTIKIDEEICSKGFMDNIPTYVTIDNSTEMNNLN